MLIRLEISIDSSVIGWAGIEIPLVNHSNTAEDVDSDALAALVLNRLKGGLKVVAVKDRIYISFN